MTIQTELSLDTEKNKFLDITHEVEKLVRNSTPSSGLCHIFIPHTSCSLILNEIAEDLEKDILNFLDSLIPEENNYAHDDGNAHAHLRNIVLGNEKTIPFNNRTLQLGTWQRLLVLDPDGPRRRKVIITLLVNPE